MNLTLDARTRPYSIDFNVEKEQVQAIMWNMVHSKFDIWLYRQQKVGDRWFYFERLNHFSEVVNHVMSICLGFRLTPF